MGFWGGGVCCFFLHCLATLHSLQNLSSPTRDQTRAPAVRAPSPNHWTTREFPSHGVLKDKFGNSLPLGQVFFDVHSLPPHVPTTPLIKNSVSTNQLGRHFKGPLDPSLNVTGKHSKHINCNYFTSFSLHAFPCICVDAHYSLPNRFLSIRCFFPEINLLKGKLCKN